MGMLKQASLEDLTSGRVTRDQGYIVVCMHYYPRFLKKGLRDEFVNSLSPDKVLMADYLVALKKHGDHNKAFTGVNYEKRFSLSNEALTELERLCQLSSNQNVYLVCKCGKGEQCHRDLLLLLAGELFGARTQKPRFDYPVFKNRMVSAALDGE